MTGLYINITEKGLEGGGANVNFNISVDESTGTDLEKVFGCFLIKAISEEYHKLSKLIKEDPEEFLKYGEEFLKSIPEVVKND